MVIAAGDNGDEFDFVVRLEFLIVSDEFAVADGEVELRFEADLDKGLFDSEAVFDFVGLVTVGEGGRHGLIVICDAECVNLSA